MGLLTVLRKSKVKQREIRVLMVYVVLVCHHLHDLTGINIFCIED